MTFKKLNEAIKVKKMNLPTSSKYFTLNWNDKNLHNLYDRIKDRTFLSRKELIIKIKNGLDSIHEKLLYGPYVIKFKESEFYLSIFKEENSDIVNIKTILTFDMSLRKNDRVMTINEAEEMFGFDFSEFYEDGFVNSYYGNLLIEESLDRKTLQVFPEYIEINN